MNPPFRFTSLFLEEIFHAHPFYQITGSQSPQVPLIQRKGELNVETIA